MDFEGLCLKSAEASRQGRNVYRKRRFTRCRAPSGAKCCRYAAPLGRVLFNASMAINIARLTARLLRQSHFAAKNRFPAAASMIGSKIYARKPEPQTWRTFRCTLVALTRRRLRWLGTLMRNYLKNRTMRRVEFDVILSFTNWLHATPPASRTKP